MEEGGCCTPRVLLAFPGCVHELGFRQDLTDCANARKQCAHDETMSNPHGCALFPETKTTRKYVHTRLVRIGPFRRHSRLSKAVPRSAISSTAHRPHFVRFVSMRLSQLSPRTASPSHNHKNATTRNRNKARAYKDPTYFFFFGASKHAPPPLPPARFKVTPRVLLHA